MSFGGYLFCLLVQPIKLIFEFLFFYAYAFTNNVGLSIVVLSLAINILVLPLYNRADLIQKEAREKEDRLRPMADHIKKSFKGDERIMMLQTYYGHMHYSPLSSVKSSLSLILQIPFFIAAYSFLVDLRLLVGQSLGPIADLSVPDHLIRFGSVSLNLLPIAMTVINIASSEIFTRGKPFKSKITLYVIALFFLVFLYNCPSGLVFYWTLNNIFSLVKNIVNTRKDPKTAKSYAFSLLGGAIFVSSIFIKAAFRCLSGLRILYTVTVSVSHAGACCSAESKHCSRIYFLADISKTVKSLSVCYLSIT